MKHISIILMAALVALGATSCKKNDLDHLGTFKEGIYQPSFQISSINQGGSVSETWSWGSSKLSSISMPTEGSSYQFSYNGDQIGSVTITQPGYQTQRVNYSYGGSLLTQVEVVNGNRTDITMQVNHDANDHIATINLNLSNQFLVDMAYAMLGGMSKNPTKYSISNKQFTETLTWSGDNVVKEVLTGNVTATATLADLGDAIDLGALGSIINMIGKDIEFPLSATISQTTTYTYDDMNNPFYCLYRDGIGARNLSKNNILSSTTTGSIDITFTITVPDDIPFFGGQEIPVPRSVDLGESHTYTYTYNKKNLPETYTVDGTPYTINY